MISRREFVQVALAAAALTGGASLAGTSRAFAQQKLTEKELLAFDPLGNVTLVHVTDIHGQLMPLYFREPSTNLGVGDAKGQPPHVTGKEFLTRFGIAPGSSSAYALTSEDFEALAKTYGRIGGLDRAATVIKAIRAERGDKVVLLDGGDTWQGSWSSLQTRGQDMIDCMALLKPDAMTGHWEFTYGTERVKQAVDGLGFPFLGLNIRDTEWNEPAFEASTMIERGGVKIAVLGQAFPYTPVANPRWMIPHWSFGVREEDVQTQVDKARKARRFTWSMDAKSVITSPSPQAPIKHGKGFTIVSGLAWSGNGKVKRVDVSLDGGRNWWPARLDGPVLDKALTRFYYEFDWNGESLLLQSRVQDETGYVQPSKAELRKVRGYNSIYHNNGIQTWHVQANGEVENVEVA